MLENNGVLQIVIEYIYDVVSTINHPLRNTIMIVSGGASVEAV